ncbi:MAG: hypothetical protein IJE75_04495 [Firmicutes bacterium]|nr:hypothetical protein [Bacillota bacterium]
MIMKREKEWNGFDRFIAPALSIAGSVFMMIAAVFSHGQAVIYYLIVFAVIMVIGAFFAKKKEGLE